MNKIIELRILYKSRAIVPNLEKRAERQPRIFFKLFALDDGQMLGIGLALVRVVIPKIKKVIRIEFRLSDALEFLIIGTQHLYFRLIVPRNKAFVSNRAQKRAATQTVTDIIFPANAPNLGKDIQLDVPKFFSMGRDQETVAHFIVLNVVNVNFFVQRIHLDCAAKYSL